MRIRTERGVCQDGENPVRALLYLMLLNEERKAMVEHMPLRIGGKDHPADPEKVIERVKRSIIVRPFPAGGYEYSYLSQLFNCDIRIIANTRLCEDMSFNPYS